MIAQRVPTSWWRALLIVELFIAIIILRWHFLDMASRDYLGQLQHWIAYIRTHGLRGYGDVFNNYSPLYTYFLGIFNILFPSLRPLYLIKWVTFLGEGLAAIYAYKILSLPTAEAQKLPPLPAVLFLLLTPSVISNGAVIGQCDIWHTAFLLTAVYYILIARPNLAMVFFGLALAFKPQAMFLAPLFLLCIVKGNIPWRSIWIVPAIFVATAIPTWLEGRSLINALSVYWGVFRGGGVNYNAGNFYLYLVHAPSAWVKFFGLLLGAETGCLLVYLSYKRWPPHPQPLDTMLLATLMAGLMPFILPGMHDRYFFIADIFSFLLTCMRPRWFIIPILFQLASLMVSLDWQFPHIVMWWGWPMWNRLHVAMWINALAIVLLLWLCQHRLWTHNATATNAKCSN